jgi:beta-aspartyl-dipeptidase (metallo-type)
MVSTRYTNGHSNTIPTPALPLKQRENSCPAPQSLIANPAAVGYIAPMHSSLILLHNADVFAPDPLGHRQLLLGGGRILWIGGAGDAPPRGLPIDVIDLQGRRLLPGLVDAHVHVTGGGGEGGFASRVPPVPLSRFTAGGVTTVVGLLGTDDVARSTRELVATIYALRESGLSAWGWSGGYHVPPATLTGSVRGDIAFIECLIGVGELAISDHRSSQPSFDELLRIASEAHVAGMMSGKAGVLHLHLGNGPRGLELVRRALDESELPPRVFHPTHVNRRRALFDEALDLARRGCTIDLTAFPVEDGEDAWSAADAWLRHEGSGAPADRLTISSDAGGCLPCFDHEGRLEGMEVGAPGALMETLGELLRRGVPLQTALPAFTSNPATLLRLPGKGRIQAGADADLLVIDEHDQIRDVFCRGIPHLREGRVLRRGPFETGDTGATRHHQGS